jgi:CBS domain-containing protein
MTMPMSKLRAIDTRGHLRPRRVPATPATVADVMRPAVTTVADSDHVAAAAYLMKHAGNAALLVVDALRTGDPVGIVTEADVARAVADGKDVNEVKVHEVMTAHPAAIPAAASVRDAAKTMLARGLRQAPVTAGEPAGGADMIGTVDIADLCGALLELPPR